MLNADDPLVAEMAAATDADVVYFSTNPQQHVIAAHGAEGGRAVIVEDDAIVLLHDGKRIHLVELDRVAFTVRGKIRFQVLNALAATAAAWAAGLNPALIARALTTFSSDAGMVPGRFNVTDLNRVQLIMDYGHNAAAMQALGEAVGGLERRKTVLALALPGDRRDENLIATIDATLPFADEFVLYELSDRRGRRPNEVAQILQRRIPTHTPCAIVADQHAALREAWLHVRPGDRLIMIVDEVDDALQQAQSLAESISADASCSTPISAEVGA